MKTVEITLTGVSPLLVNRFQEAAENPETVALKKKNYGTPREQAEKTAYRDEGGQNRLWVPSTWISGAIKAIASDYKIPGSRKSMKSVAGGTILPVDEKLYFNEKYYLKDIEVDSRPCVIQQARIMKHRARLEKWSLTFKLEVDEDIVPVESVHQVLTDAGRRSGIGDFRPQKGGPFGRFQITSWKVQQ